MSEIINNREIKLSLLKEMIKKIGNETDSQQISSQLKILLKEVAYEDVITVEQELFEEGFDKDKMLELCDLHSAALKGILNPESKLKETEGHPVHTFKKENQALKREIEIVRNYFSKVNKLDDTDKAGKIFVNIHTSFNNLMDVEKHYLRKENLLFPFLEKHNITGPSAVMWGKHDQTRELLKNSIAVLSSCHNIIAGDGKGAIELILEPVLKSIEEMIYKEENILFPMAMDTLNNDEWEQVYKQSDEIGFCLYEPTEKWRPEKPEQNSKSEILNDSKIKLPTGIFNLNELTSVFNTLPFDITFVDKEDNVRFFSQGNERIFQRSKAILGRKVQYCHPPSSVHIVEKILNDFKTGAQTKAAFWINFKGRFVHISYYAVRDESNEYQGTLEVTQDLTELRLLEGEKRILEY